MARDWSRAEVESIVTDYFEMLSLELRATSYNKAEHRRRLQLHLDDRSEAAIERKHGNISAVLIDLGFPYVRGYKPYRNYQRLLVDIVTSRLDEDSRLDQLVVTAHCELDARSNCSAETVCVT